MNWDSYLKKSQLWGAKIFTELDMPKEAEKCLMFLKSMMREK